MAFGKWACRCERLRVVEQSIPEEQREPWPYSWCTEMGCETEAPGPVAHWRGQVLRRCPARLVPDWTWDVVALWPTWEAGALPNAGGVLDQPAPLVRAMRIIGATVAELREEETARASAAAQGGGGGGEAVFRARAPVTPSIRRR